VNDISYAATAPRTKDLDVQVHPTIESDRKHGVARHRSDGTLSASARSICLDASLTLSMVIMVLSPMIFTRSGFALDFTNSLWLTWAAGRALVEAGHPSYFLNANVPAMGVFYPLLAFEGGTLLAFTGGIGELLGGHPEIAFILVTALAVAGDYLGALWLARQLGLRGLMAHAPGITIVTSAYYITNLYGRGDWPEFMAVAALAPLAASAVHLVRASAWRPGAVLVFVLSAMLLTGSHNITLVWGSTMGVLGVCAVWLAFGLPRRLPYRRLAMVAGLGVASVMLNAWFLFPDAAYEGLVAAHSFGPPPGVSLWGTYSFFNTPAVLLDPLRVVPKQSSTPALYVQAPVWFLAWGVLVGGLLLRRKLVDRTLGRLWICALILVLLVLSLIMIAPLWNFVPFPYNEIQFAYRLCSYVFYAVAGLVLVSALALQRCEIKGPLGIVRGSRAALVGVCAVSVLLCSSQLWLAHTTFPNSYKNRGEALASTSIVPRTWYTVPGAYSDQQAPVVEVSDARLVKISPEDVRGDRFETTAEFPQGPQPIQTNIDAGSYLVHIAGVEAIGRDPLGLVVVKRLSNNLRGPVHIVVETAHNAVIRIARATSVVAALLVLLVLSWTCAPHSLAALRKLKRVRSSR
jgi:hypothetical protein